MTLSAIIAIASFLAGIAFQRSLTAYRVGKREAARDDFRFAISPIVQHSPEDAARHAGC